MSLLAPFKLCLQCLPVFSSKSPPSSPRTSSAGEAKAKDAHLHSPPTSPGNASAGCTLSEGEKPSFSDASLIHDSEQKDLPISEQAKIELVDAPHGAGSTHASSPAVVHVHTYTPEAGKDNAHLDVSQQAPSKQETPHIIVMPTHGVNFSTSGMMPLPSPITPTPIGLGYIVGQHAASHQVHHQVSSHHNEGHSFFHIHSHDHKAHPLSSYSHSTPHEKDLSMLPPPGKEHASPSSSSAHSGNVHEISPLPAQSGKELASKPSNDKGPESKEHSHRQHHQGGKYDHTPPNPPSEGSVAKHEDHPRPHEKHMETSHSVPHVNLVASHADTSDHDAGTKGVSSVLVTSHSEPIEGIGAVGRVRHRDHLKHHLKELHDQLKQGGHHLKEEGSKHLQSIANLKEEGSRHLQSIANLKEEGSKHLQNMVSNMSKRAGQMEESGSFSMGSHGNTT